jgi:hypothetical protein
MKYEIFEFHGDMTASEIFWRVLLLSGIIAVVVLDLFVWRP